MYLVKGTGRDDSLVARLRDRLPVRVDGVHLVLEPRVFDGLVVRERGLGLLGVGAYFYLGIMMAVVRRPRLLFVNPTNAAEPRRRLPLALSLQDFLRRIRPGRVRLLLLRRRRRTRRRPLLSTASMSGTARRLPVAVHVHRSDLKKAKSAHPQNPELASCKTLASTGSSHKNRSSALAEAPERHQGRRKTPSSLPLPHSEPPAALWA